MINNIQNAIIKLSEEKNFSLSEIEKVKIQVKVRGEILSTIVNPKENIITLDLETQFLADEVGGWGNIPDMKIAIVCIYSSREDKFYSYTEEQVPELIKKLKEATLIVGFNIINFDYRVIQPYTDFDLSTLKTYDILTEVYKKLGYRVSLQNFAEATLGSSKSGDGVQSVQWFRAGEIDKVKEYCQKDVEVTKNLYLHLKKVGPLRYYDKKSDDVKFVKLEVNNV
jgi:DEAD/DEAH box helicase domain-containing protein